MDSVCKAAVNISTDSMIGHVGERSFGSTASVDFMARPPPTHTAGHEQPDCKVESSRSTSDMTGLAHLYRASPR
jgi:hypothetical protein